MKNKLALIFLNYLRLLAKIQLSKVKILLQFQHKKLAIVGITGSAGKTSTLLAAKAALGHQYKVKTNYGGNSESGIPLNILGLKNSDFSLIDWLKIALLSPIKLLTNWSTYDIYLVEMGIDGPDEPKNMSYLLKIIQPQTGVFLNVNPVHSALFDRTVPPKVVGQNRLKKILQHIAREKASLIKTLPKNGTAIINADDPYVINACQNIKVKIVYLNPHDFSSIKIKNHLLPSNYYYSLAAAAAIAQTFGLTKSEINNNLNKYLKLPPSRSDLYSGINNSQIIDSSYNSSPDATHDMLKLLSALPPPRIAVLGDMRELGLQSTSAHQELYSFAQKSADLIIGIGPETQKYFTSSPTFQFWWHAADFLKNKILCDKKFHHASILVKGSQNTIYLEELVKSILANPADSSKLCRQSPHWLKLKAKFHAANS